MHKQRDVSYSFCHAISSDSQLEIYCEESIKQWGNGGKLEVGNKRSQWAYSLMS